MKKGMDLSIKIEKMEFPNIGVGTAEGRPVYMKNALPNQTVRARLSKVRGSYAEAKIMEVEEVSPFEVDSFCDHFGLCGGCSLQTLPYDAQLNMKAEMIGKLIADATEGVCDFGGVIANPNVFRYRNKMEFTFGDLTKDGEMELGMHKKGFFNSVVTVDKCQICDEDFNLILSSALKFFKDLSIPHYNKFKHTGNLRHLMVRKGEKTGEILIALSAKSGDELPLEAFKDMLLNLSLKGHIVGILHVRNEEKSDAFQGPYEVLFGRDHYFDEILGLKFKVSLYSFFQTNTIGAELLYSKAVDFLGGIDGKYIFDLYSGTGTIGQILSKRASKVVGIEIVADAVDMARENAALNNLTNCTFLAGDVFEQLDLLKDEKPDLIVVDPPRSGITPKSLDKIIAYGVNEMVYISCNPKTLAENLVQLKAAGYEAVKAIGVDMFSHTPHVEAIVLMTRSGSGVKK